MEPVRNVVTVRWFDSHHLCCDDYLFHYYSHDFILRNFSDFMYIMGFVNHLRRSSGVSSVVVSDGVRSFSFDKKN